MINIVTTAPKNSAKETITSNRTIVNQVIGNVLSPLSLSIFAIFAGVILNSKGIIATRINNIVISIFGNTSAFKVSPKIAGASGNFPAS